jgi:formate dehydrogenase major subunit
MITALAHVIVTEGWLADAYIDERCDAKSFAQWREFVARPENSPEATADITGVAPSARRGALYARAPRIIQGGNSAIYYGLGVTEHAQGSTMVMGIANLAMATAMWAAKAWA